MNRGGYGRAAGIIVLDIYRQIAVQFRIESEVA